MHAEAERTELTLLPERVAEVIERHEARRRTRMAAWREHIRTAQAWRAGHERMAAAGATRSAGVDVESGCELQMTPQLWTAGGETPRAVTRSALTGHRDDE
jgi:hypothetical protein